jgi:hypothetical protein
MIEQVALATGHRDWNMLRRYTHISPEKLHATRAALAGSSSTNKIGKVRTSAAFFHLEVSAASGKDQIRRLSHRRHSANLSSIASQAPGT